MQTLCTLMQTFCRHSADIMQTSINVSIWHTFLFKFVISGNFLYCTLISPGPMWRQRDGSVLVASRRFDWLRSRKTKGSLADTLQCNKSAKSASGTLHAHFVMSQWYRHAYLMQTLSMRMNTLCRLYANSKQTFQMHT